MGQVIKDTTKESIEKQVVIIKAPKVTHLNVTTPFLNGKLKEKIYMSSPEGCLWITTICISMVMKE